MNAEKMHATCTGLDWNIMLGVLAQLNRANRIREYLLIGTGCYLGLRANDLLNLRWIDCRFQLKSVQVFQSKSVQLYQS